MEKKEQKWKFKGKIISGNFTQQFRNCNKISGNIIARNFKFAKGNRGFLKYGEHQRTAAEENHVILL